MANIRYLVDDTEAAVSFYVDILGFKLVEQWGPHFAIVGMGDLHLWLSGPNTSAAQPMPDGRRPEPGGWNRLVIEVEDLDAVVEQMRLGNVTFRSEAITGPGGKQVVIEDLSGNPIEFFQPA